MAVMTLKSFKDMAQTRNYEALREVRDGKVTNETEYRRIMGMQGKSVVFRMSNGRYVTQPLPRKELCSFTGETLVIHAANFRSMTAEEESFVKQWMKKSQEIKLRNPGINLRVVKQDYFRNHGYEYLLGTKKIKGKRYDWSSGLVEDETSQGEVIHVYRIRPYSG